MKKLYLLFTLIFLTGCSSLQWQTNSYTSQPKPNTSNLNFILDYQSYFLDNNYLWYNRYYRDNTLWGLGFSYPWNPYFNRYYTWGSWYRNPYTRYNNYWYRPWNNSYYSRSNSQPKRTDIAHIRGKRGNKSSNYKVTPTQRNKTSSPKPTSLRRIYTSPQYRRTSNSTRTSTSNTINPRAIRSNRSNIKGSRGSTNRVIPYKSFKTSRSISTSRRNGSRREN